MDPNFCQYYEGDGSRPSNRYCRDCPHSHLACDVLWEKVIELSTSNDGAPVKIPNSNAYLLPPKRDSNIVYLRVTSEWGMPKEDFLHFISTGYAKSGTANQRSEKTRSPSLTRQEPYVQGIVAFLGGKAIPEITAVRQVLHGKNT